MHESFALLNRLVQGVHSNSSRRLQAGIDESRQVGLNKFLSQLRRLAGPNLHATGGLRSCLASALGWGLHSLFRNQDHAGDVDQLAALLAGQFLQPPEGLLFVE
jgi:hypothetical protein